MVGNDHGNDHSGGSLAEQLRAQMRALVGAFATTRGRQIALTLAASDPESEMTRAFRNRVILSSRERGRELIDEAVRAGVIKPPVDPEVLLDMLYAPVFYRLLLGHLPLGPGFADSLVNAALVLVETPGKAGDRSGDPRASHSETR